MGELSRWMVTPRPGELGGVEAGETKIKAASTGGRQRIDGSQVRGGRKREIQKRLKQVGQEESRIFVKIVTEPTYGAVPAQGWNTTTS